jgi:hypothetical protein
MYYQQQQHLYGGFAPNQQPAGGPSAYGRPVPPQQQQPQYAYAQQQQMQQQQVPRTGQLHTGLLHNPAAGYGVGAPSLGFPIQQQQMLAAQVQQRPPEPQQRKGFFSRLFT